MQPGAGEQHELVVCGGEWVSIGKEQGKSGESEAVDLNGPSGTDSVMALVEQEGVDQIIHSALFLYVEILDVHKRSLIRPVKIAFFAFQGDHRHFFPWIRGSVKKHS